MYDLVVVGAGPVGSHLAREFAEKGRDVLLLEKGEVGKPLKGTGHISTDLFEHVPKDESFVEREIHGAVVHNNGSSFSFGRDHHTSYVINRPKFDVFMAKRAEEAGVDLRYEKFLDYENKGSNLEIKTYEGTYETRMLAGCDGPLSDVRLAAGLERPGLFLQGIFTLVDEPAEQSFVEVFLGASDDFFGWKVPRKGKTEYGLCTELGNDSRSLLEEFSEEEGFKIGGIYSGLVPILPPKKVTEERLFLCGDAAGQVKPFSGGGVIYGLTAAEIAAETIDPEDASTVEKYEKRWREELGKEIKLGDKIRKTYKLPFFLRAPFLWLGEKMSGGAHMDRPSTLIK
ncbi:MAG: geranylgeranyl reductase family protein [Candidatus Aenigmatarchaeota archaeon]